MGRRKAYHSTVTNLQRLDDMQQCLGGFPTNNPAAAVLSGVVDLGRAVHGRYGCGGVGEHTCETHVVGLAGNVG